MVFGRCGGAHVGHVYCIHRYEDVQQVLQGGQLGYEFLDHLTEGLEYGVVVDAGQVETGRGWG